MKISIITVVYNNARTVRDALESVLSQDYSPLEYLVIDGGSTDGTVEVLNEYRDRIDHLVSERDRGIYDGMNKGLARVTGDIVGTLNSDDVYENSSVLSQVARVFEDPAVEACYGDLVYVRSHDISQVTRYWRSCILEYSLFEQGWVPPHPTFFVRRSVYEKFGGFNLDYKLAADYELMVRFLYRHRIQAAYIPELMVRMREGGATNKSLGNIVKQNLEILRAGRRNHLHCNPVSFLFHKLWSRLAQFSSKPQS